MRVGYRVKGGLGDINDEAAFYAMGLSFFLPLIVRAGSFSRRTRLLLAGCMALSFFGLVLPNSRGALVSFAITGLLYFGAFRRKLLVFYVALVVFGWAALPGTVRDRLSGTYSEVVESGAEYDVMNVRSGGRLDIWKATLDASMQNANAVIGVGFGNLPILVHEEIKEFRNSHNVYLQILGETGIPGLVTFFALMVVMFRMGLRLRRRGDPLDVGVGDGIISAVICLAVANIFGDRFLAFSLEALVVFMAAIGARLLMNSDSNPDASPDARTAPVYSKV
jgi:O-antigen ligase